MNMTEAVKQLIIINIIFFAGRYFIGDAASVLALYFPENPNFYFWQPITHMFMHGGIMHLFFNMFALFSFGILLERMWGAKKFLFFYFSCGLGAAALHIAVNYISFYQVADVLMAQGLSKQDIMTALTTSNFDAFNGKIDQATFDKLASAFYTPAVGASGAIYGVLVAFAFMVPNAELMMLFIPIPIKAKYFVPGLLAIDLFLGLKGQSIFGAGSTGIAHFAHIGGAVIGFIMMWYWKKNQFNNNRWN